MHRLILGILLVGLSGSPAASAQTCRINPVPNPPSWLTSGTYDEASGMIVLVGARDAELRSYRFENDRLEAVPSVLDAQAASQSSNFPISLKRTSTGYLVGLTGGTALQLGNDFRRLNSFGLTTTPRGQATGLGAVYEWLPAGQRVFGVGSVRNVPRDLTRDAPYQAGLFLADLTPGGIANARMIQPIGPNDYYLTGLTTLATIGDRTGYFLDLGEKPRIRILDLKRGRITGEIPMPSDAFRILPRLSVRSDGPDAFPVIQGEIEQRTMPAGLYAFKDRLFLLTRQPNSGGTRWLLHEWDPSAGEYKAPIRLPTAAPHLLMLGQGEQNLYLVEKGSVVKWGVQEVGSVVTVPLSWLAPSSPLADGTTVTCALPR